MNEQSINTNEYAKNDSRRDSSVGPLCPHSYFNICKHRVITQHFKSFLYPSLITIHSLDYIHEIRLVDIVDSTYMPKNKKKIFIVF